MVSFPKWALGFGGRRWCCLLRKQAWQWESAASDMDIMTFAWPVDMLASPPPYRTTPCHRAFSLAWTQCSAPSQYHLMHSHTISASTPGLVLFWVLSFFSFGGGVDSGGVLTPSCVCVMLCNGACLRHAHCGLPHPTPLRILLHVFWTHSIIRLVPPIASVLHLCHCLDYSMKELEHTQYSQYDVYPKEHKNSILSISTKKKSTFFSPASSYIFFDHALLFLTA